MDAGKGIGAMLALGIALYGFIDLEYYGIQTRGGEFSKFLEYEKEFGAFKPVKAPQPEPRMGGGMDA